ncbi:MAG: hypothetical protein P8I34_06540 [Flavobacteriaceae bacterium]|nr:hypothetical protein [Flavobacteriaceae bacterium]MDG1966275.1 hypothetical protein [Flavobacteriaceae bacterium]
MKNYKAIFYMLLSTLFFAMMNSMVKYLADYGAFQLFFFGSLGRLFMGSAAV